MTETTALTTQTAAAPGPLSFLHDGAAFEHLWRVAKAFSMSGMVPGHFQGKPESCMVALMYAQQLGEHPMVMFQEVTVINGRPGTSARFAIARANKSGILAGPITWASKGQGESLEVQARAVLAATGEEISVVVTMKEAVADGWTRNNKYKSIPEQMLRWRAATRLINLYMPEVLFGLGVKDEVEQAQVRNVSVSSNAVVADLNQRIQRQIAPVEVLDAQPAAQVEPTTTPEPVEAEPLETVQDPLAVFSEQ
jgi:CBS domain-containing protein